MPPTPPLPLPPLHKLGLRAAPVGAPEANAPTLDPNVEEPEEGEITEPNWETAVGIVAKVLLDNLDPERCKDPAKLCIASSAFNREWCNNPLFWFALLEKLGWSVCTIVRTPTRTIPIPNARASSRRSRWWTSIFSAHQRHGAAAPVDL